jgi:hypothetical protein
VVAGVLLVALALVAVALVLVLDDDTSTTSTVGSGVVATETRELPPFAAVDLAGANTVTIGVGGAQSVVVQGDDDVIPLVTTEVEDGTLVIAQSESFDTTAPLSVEIVVPSLDAVRLSGTGTVTVDGHDLALLELSLPGSGTLRGSGDAQRLVVELGGAGDVALQNLAADDIVVELAGSGNVHVNASESLDAAISGTGSIFYAGDPASVAQSITGTGVIVEE